MICPKCGHKMKDDMLYCENCGEEIQFVPDFEPEIEQSISDTLSEISLKDFEGDFVDEYDDIESGDESYNEEYSEEYNDEYYEDEYENDNSSIVNDADEYYDSDENEYLDDNNQEEYYEDEEYQDDEFVEEYSEEDYGYDDDYDDDDYDDEAFLDDIDPFDDNYESHVLRHFFRTIFKSKLKWIFLILLIGLIGGGFYLFSKVSDKIKVNNSVDYQLELATQAAADGDFKKAIEYMEKAISLNPKDVSKKFILAEYYFSNNEEEKGILMFWEIISEGGDNSQDAYRKIINYYIEKQDYAMINDIVTACNDETIKTEFGNYMANVPLFNIPEGTYEDTISVILSGEDVGGYIYYTLDGSEPTTESLIYTSPIEFSELGIYSICAMYVNSFGIQSDIIRKTYTIDLSTPKPPNILLDAGTYDIPLLIEVDVQNYCEVYYTTDGTEPSKYTSTMYMHPIPMPIGTTNFKFIAVSIDGTPSEITDVTYTLNVSSTFNISSIETCLLNYDFLQGKTVDLQGHLIGNTSTLFSYEVSSALAFNKNHTPVLLDHGIEGEEKIPDIEQVKELKKNEIDMYYLITENVMDLQNKTTITNVFYLCNIETGQLYKTSRNTEGFFVIGEEITADMYTLPVYTVDETDENQDF